MWCKCAQTTSGDVQTCKVTLYYINVNLIAFLIDSQRPCRQAALRRTSFWRQRITRPSLPLNSVLCHVWPVDNEFILPPCPFSVSGSVGHPDWRPRGGAEAWGSLPRSVCEGWCCRNITTVIESVMCEREHVTLRLFNITHIDILNRDSTAAMCTYILWKLSEH